MTNKPDIEEPTSLAVMKEALHELNRIIFMQLVNIELVDKQILRMSLLTDSTNKNKDQRDYLLQTKQNLGNTLQDIEAKRDLVVNRIVAILPDKDAK